MDKSEFNVRAILASEAPGDMPVTVKGWVRTRRDSKAGISFVHVSDGSSFHSLQVVVPNTLANYNNEILRLTAGCAVAATGAIVPSPAKGQPFEMPASAVRVISFCVGPCRCRAALAPLSAIPRVSPAAQYLLYRIGSVIDGRRAVISLDERKPYMLHGQFR